jgi:hypothetical protein
MFIPQKAFVSVFGREALLAYRDLDQMAAPGGKVRFAS